MKAVYPTAFVFRQQNISCAQKKTGYQLTIDFNFDGSCEQKPKDFKFIESSVLIARQKYFKNKLLKLTMSHHRVYLAKNYPSLSVKDEEIKRWHPCFPLDEVPEAEQSPLPEPPEVKTFSTAQDVLDQARLKLTPRVCTKLNLVSKFGQLGAIPWLIFFYICRLRRLWIMSQRNLCKLTLQKPMWK